MFKSDLKLIVLFCLSIGLILSIRPAFAGDPAPGVDVLLEQIPGGVVYKGKSDANGIIIFGAVQPGNYKLVLSKSEPVVSTQTSRATREQVERALRNRGSQEALRRLPGTVRRVPGVVARSGQTSRSTPVEPEAPATLSFCSQSTSGNNKTSCPQISGFSQSGGVTSVMFDPAQLSQGAVCGEITVSSAGEVAMTARTIDLPTPQMAESLNSVRSNTSGVTRPVQNTPDASQN